MEEVNDAGLDTAPDAFHARWSPDSRHVALSYRTDRHINALRIYRIEHRRAFPVNGPGLLATIAPDFRLEDLDVTAHYRELEWLSPTRFRLHEDGYVRQLSEEAAKSLGPFGAVEPADPADPSFGRGLSFSIEAVCEFAGQDQYSIRTIKPGTWKLQSSS